MKNPNDKHFLTKTHYNVKLTNPKKQKNQKNENTEKREIREIREIRKIFF